MKILVLRPQPGADETAARARAMALEPVVAPLFDIHPLAWTPPDPAAFDAVLLTSSNAARHGGEGLAALLALPCLAVGDATAAAARASGFAEVRTGPSDGAAALAMAHGNGARRILHLCGHDRIALAGITQIPVYSAEPAGALPAGFETMLALLHSPRAAMRFAALVGERRGAVRIAAISDQTAQVAGDGWRSLDVAAAPRDQALLELAGKLCHTESE